MNHTCHAHGCTTEVPARLFVCPPHWAKLRQSLKSAIWTEYTPGQEVKKNPTARYLCVQQRAVAELAFKPNDEAAAQLSAHYLWESEKWRRVAIEAGAGDPLQGVVE